MFAVWDESGGNKVSLSCLLCLFVLLKQNFQDTTSVFYLVEGGRLYS